MLTHSAIVLVPTIFKFQWTVHSELLWQTTREMGHKHCTTREGHQITIPTASGDQIMYQDFRDRNFISLEMLAGNRQRGIKVLSLSSGTEEKLCQFLLAKLRSYLQYQYWDCGFVGFDIMHSCSSEAVVTIFKVERCQNPKHHSGNIKIITSVSDPSSAKLF
jgi:hypothetical protein